MFDSFNDPKYLFSRTSGQSLSGMQLLRGLRAMPLGTKTDSADMIVPVGSTPFSISQVGYNFLTMDLGNRVILPRLILYC